MAAGLLSSWACSAASPRTPSHTDTDPPARPGARGQLARVAILAATLTLACQTPPPQRLSYDALPLARVDRELEYAVYTPPGFRPDERLPLVIFLHGAGDGPDCFDEAGVGLHLDAAIAAGRVPRAVIAVPRGDFGFWENWADGSFRYRDWVVRSLMPRLTTRYGTAPCPDGCHVIGVSMGGHGALRFALLEPESFASVSVVSAPIADTAAAWHLTRESWLRFLIPTERIWGRPEREVIERDDPFLRWREPGDLEGIRLMLAWGRSDHPPIVESNRRFQQHLAASGIPHQALVFPGGHDWQAWTPALEAILAIQVAPAGGTAPASHPARASTPQARTKAPAAQTRAPAAQTRAPAAQTRAPAAQTK